MINLYTPYKIQIERYEKVNKKKQQCINPQGTHGLQTHVQQEKARKM